MASNPAQAREHVFKTPVVKFASHTIMSVLYISLLAWGLLGWPWQGQEWMRHSAFLTPTASLIGSSFSGYGPSSEVGDLTPDESLLFNPPIGMSFADSCCCVVLRLSY